MLCIINSTGDYLKTLFDFLTDQFGETATVYYEDDEPVLSNKPCVMVCSPEIDEATYSDDGRQEDVLMNSILVKVPNSIDTPAVVALDIGGFIRGILPNQTFSKYIDPEIDSVDAPEEIQGQPIKWAKRDKADAVNLKGYEITFIQTIRYGTEAETAFILKAIDIKETHGERERIYERKDN